jgi:UDP-GlcNAc:undecaprenyl-phosphate GlcNAc-1-phosphate transferase
VLEIVGAFVVATAAAALLIPLSRRFGFLDHPGPIKPHARPVPPAGGTAILVALLVMGTLLSLPLSLLGGAIAIWLVGLVDDARHLKPALKLLAQVPPLVVGSFALDLPPFERAMAVGVGLVLVNVFNVIDGLDGLAGGSAAIMLAVILVLGSPLSATAAIALGGVLAFLLFNLPPARLFLGDEGSLLLGYVLWVVPLAALAATPSTRLLLAFTLTWMFPLVNALFVVVARFHERRPILAGDRSHLYDVLHKRLGLRGALALCWVLSAIGGIAAAAVA